jgi:hypothetical protein
MLLEPRLAVLSSTVDNCIDFYTNIYRAHSLAYTSLRPFIFNGLENPQNL